MNFKLINNIQDLTDLSNDWNSLALNYGSPILSYEWILSAIQTLHKNDQIYIYVLIKNNQACAIAPLVLLKDNGISSLHNIGINPLHEPTDWLYDSNESAAALLKHITKQGIPLTLLRMPDDSPITQTLQKNSSLMGKSIVRESAASYFISLKDVSNQVKPEGSILDLVSSKRRHDLKRRMIKCLEKHGNISEHVVTPDKDNINDHLYKIMQIEDASWKGSEGSSLLKNKLLRSFFESYCNMVCEKKLLKIFYLNVNEQSIAMHLCIEYANSLWILKIGHNNVFNKCSPGMLVSKNTILYSESNKLDKYEFLGSVEKWQAFWPVKTHKLATCIYIPVSFKGFFYAIGLARHLILRRFTNN